MNVFRPTLLLVILLISLALIFVYPSDIVMMKLWGRVNETIQIISNMVGIIGLVVFVLMLDLVLFPIENKTESKKKETENNKKEVKRI